MKTKIFALFAAMMLLVGTTAIAQSDDTKNTSTTETSLKGDVNNDGVVDVADIAAVIAVMHEQGTVDMTQYFWYAGQEEPTSMDENPVADDENYTNNKWHTLADDINEFVGSSFIAKTITGGTSGNDWYVAVPSIKDLKPTASDNITPNTSWDIVENISINGVEYTVWRTNSTSARQAVYMAKI